MRMLTASLFCLALTAYPGPAHPLTVVVDRTVDVGPGATGLTHINLAIKKVLEDEGGGIVKIPTGVYSMQSGGITYDDISNITIECEPGAILLLTGPGAHEFFHFRNSSRIQVRGCTFRVDDSTRTTPLLDFTRMLQFENCDNITVSGCRFEMIDTPSVLSTHHLLRVLNSSDVLVENNYAINSQFQFRAHNDTRCVGSQNLSRVVVNNNTFVTPYNYAISVIGDRPDHHISNISLTNNHIYSPSSGGFHIGVDDDNNDIGTLSHIVIDGNTISGTWNTIPQSQPFGISVRAGINSSNWQITDNIVSADVVPSVAVMWGIQTDRSVNGSEVSDLRISGNHIHGMMTYGIRVVTGVVNGNISNNVISNTSGIWLQPGGCGVRNLVIAGNTINDANVALLVRRDKPVPDPSTDGFLQVLITGNLLHGTTHDYWRALNTTNPMLFDVAFLNNHLGDGQYHSNSPAGFGVPPTGEVCRGNVPVDCDGTTMGGEGSASP